MQWLSTSVSFLNIVNSGSWKQRWGRLQSKSCSEKSKCVYWQTSKPLPYLLNESVFHQQLCCYWLINCIFFPHCSELHVRCRWWHLAHLSSAQRQEQPLKSGPTQPLSQINTRARSGIWRVSKLTSQVPAWENPLFPPTQCFHILNMFLQVSVSDITACTEKKLTNNTAHHEVLG